MRSGCGQVGTRGEQPGQPVVRPAPQLVGERAVPVGGHPANSRDAARSGDPGRAPPRSGHRRRAAPREQRGRLPGRAAGLRRRRRHGRPRERRRRQPDRGRGVRPARRRGLRPDPRHRGRHRDARGRASAGSRSTPRPSGPGPRRTPGTTVVAALLVEDDGAPAWLLANLGDSRIYARQRRRAAPGQRRPQRRPGAGRLRRDHRRPRRTSTPSGTSSPARWAGRGSSRPTSSCSR